MLSSKGGMLPHVTIFVTLLDDFFAVKKKVDDFFAHDKIYDQFFRTTPPELDKIFAPSFLKKVLDKPPARGVSWDHSTR